MHKKAFRCLVLGLQVLHGEVLRYARIRRTERVIELIESEVTFFFFLGGGRGG